jgi:hypothetical protein
MKRVTIHCAWCDRPFETVDLGYGVCECICTACPDPVGEAYELGRQHARQGIVNRLKAYAAEVGRDMVEHATDKTVGRAISTAIVAFVEDLTEVVTQEKA